MTDQPALMTVEEAATYLRTASVTVYKLMRSGALPGVKVGHSWRIRRADLDMYIRGNAQQQPSVRRKRPTER
jgi:excisionase family DNA binding protein